MPQFPNLKCGSALQYPATRAVQYSTHIIRFVDGSEQRFRERKNPGVRWSSRLTLLDDAEARSLSAFFEERSGQFGTFSFTDPWDGLVYPVCRFVAGTLDRRQEDEARFSVSLEIEASNT